MSIFGNKYLDFLIIFFPTIVGLTIMNFFYDKPFIPIFLFITMHFIDVGHVYTTNIETLLSKKAFKENRKTWMVPLFLALFITVWWIGFDLIFFWIFVVYFTIYHNLRQGYGFVKLYEKKNENFVSFTKLIYHLLVVIPWVCFHFRNTKLSLVNYYSLDVPSLYLFGETYSVFGYEFDNIYLFLGLCTLILTYLIWFGLELKLFLKIKKLEYNRILCILNFSIGYFYAFFLGETEAQLMALLVLPHGIPYMYLLIHKKSFSTKGKVILAAVIVIGLAIIGGFLDVWYENNLYVGDSMMNPKNWKEFTIILLYITPILSHFVWDSYLWKIKK